MKKGIIYFSFLCCLSAICQDATISALSSKELEATIADLQNQIKLNNKDGLAYLKLANAYALQDDVEEKVIIKNFDKSKRYLAGAAREELFLDYSYFLYDHKKIINY